ncbi:MAG: hypothetical protein ACR2PL_28065 [Dehalococcoidia bacterium]
MTLPPEQHGLLEEYQQDWTLLFVDIVARERLSASLVRRLDLVNTVAGLTAGITASGSTIAGLALWGSSAGKVIWAIIASIAALSAIVINVLHVTDRIPKEQEIQQQYRQLASEAEAFRRALTKSLDSHQAEAEFNDLRRRLAQAQQSAPSTILELGGLPRRAVQDAETELRRRGYVQ